MPKILGDGLFCDIAIILLVLVIPIMIAWFGKDIMDDEHATGGTRDKGNILHKVGLTWIAIEIIDAVAEWLNLI